jgi:hypothetical protein
MLNMTDDELRATIAAMRQQQDETRQEFFRVMSTSPISDTASALYARVLQLDARIEQLSGYLPDDPNR